MLGAVKPPTAKVPVILDQFAAMSFLGVLASALNAEIGAEGTVAVRRRWWANRWAPTCSPWWTTARSCRGRAPAPSTTRACPAVAPSCSPAGTLNGFLHDTYTATRTGDGQASTGNAKRGSYKGAPGVGTSNFYLDAGETSFDELLQRAEGGVLIQDVAGVHSGANPISGEFSVGATGLRIAGGALGEPLREMTIASTLPEMLAGITGVGDDLRFFSSVGTPSILIGEMTLAGI